MSKGSKPIDTAKAGAKPLEAPEDSIPIRVLCCLLSIVAISASFVFGKSPVPVVAFNPLDGAVLTISIWLCVGGNILSYNIRNDVPPYMKKLLHTGAILIALNLARELWTTNLHVAQFEFIPALVNALVATSVLTSFELRARSDIMATSTFGLLLMALAGCSGRSILFGACVLLYIGLGAVLLCLMARSYCIASAGVDRRSVFTTTRGAYKPALVGSVIILPILSLAGFSFVPRLDALADNISTRVRSAVTSFVYHTRSDYLAYRSGQGTLQFSKGDLKPASPNEKSHFNDKRSSLPPSGKEKSAKPPEKKGSTPVGKTDKKLPPQPKTGNPPEPAKPQSPLRNKPQQPTSIPAPGIPLGKQPPPPKQATPAPQAANKPAPQPPKTPPRQPKPSNQDLLIPPLTGPKNNPAQQRSEQPPRAPVQNNSKPPVPNPKQPAPSKPQPPKANKTEAQAPKSPAKPQTAQKPAAPGAEPKSDAKPAAPPAAPPALPKLSDGKSQAPGSTTAGGELIGIGDPLHEPISAPMSTSNQIIFTLACNRSVYVKASVLDQFDGKTWSVSPGQGSGLITPNIEGVDVWSSEALQVSDACPVVDLSETFTLRTPLQHLVLSAGTAKHVSLLQALNVDHCGNIELTQTLPAGTKYTAVCYWPVYSVRDMRLSASYGDTDDHAVAPFLVIPDDQSKDTIDLASRLTAGGANRFVQAEAIVEYLRKNYKYGGTPVSSESGGNLADKFLFESKEGDCKAFATAFVILSRAAGIPSRFVAGYTPGDPDPMTGETCVRAKHGHAWAEIFMEPYGWIAFDPTPGGLLPARPEEQYYNYKEVDKQIRHYAATTGSQFNISVHTVILYAGYLVMAASVGVFIVLAVLIWKTMRKALNALKQRLKRWHPAMRLRDRVLRKLKKLGVERQPADTGNDVIERLERALADQTVDNQHELRKSVGEFFDTYNAVVYGGTKEMPQLQALTSSIEKQIK